MIRFVSAVVVLTLLVGSPSAHGEDVTQPVPTDGKCSVPADPQWTPQEKFVWQHVCVGDVANFNLGSDYGGNLDPKRSEGLPDSRILRPAFLETILLSDKYRHVLTRFGVRIIGARFTKTVDLEDAQLGHELWLNRSLLEQGANFLRVKSSGTINMSGSKVAGVLNLNELQVDRDLFLTSGGEYVEVALRDAHVGGLVDLIGSKVTGTLDMHDFHVDHSLFLVNAELAKVVLIGAHVGGVIDVIGSKVIGTLDMDSLQVDHNLLMRDKAEFGAVVLRGAHVGGQISMVGSKVTGTLNMDSLHVDQDLLMREAEFGAIVLRDAYVGGQLSLSGSKVAGTLTMENLQVGSIVFLGRDAVFDGPISFIFGKVVGNVDFAGGLFKSIVDLTATQIGGELRLGLQNLPARWVTSSALILRNAKADAIQDLSNSWPDKLDLNGFTYRSLGGLLANEKDPMIDRPVGWSEAWLAKQKPYTPAPYEQLATVLRNEGKPDVADEILYAGKEQERSQSSSMTYIEATANKWFIGYGYHKFWSIYWALAFLITGTVLLWLSGEGRRVSRHYSLPYGIFYSFDLLLPIIRLREKHYQIDLKGWIRYYFYVHRIMGYVLASFLIAGISGLTK